MFFRLWDVCFKSYSWFVSSQKHAVKRTNYSIAHSNDHFRQDTSGPVKTRDVEHYKQNRNPIIDCLIPALSCWWPRNLYLTLSSWHFYVIRKWINRKPSGRQMRGDTWQRSRVRVKPVTSRPRRYVPPSYLADCKTHEEEGAEDFDECIVVLFCLHLRGNLPRDNLWVNLPLIGCRDSSGGKMSQFDGKIWRALRCLFGVLCSSYLSWSFRSTTRSSLRMKCDMCNQQGRLWGPLTRQYKSKSRYLM